MKNPFKSIKAKPANPQTLQEMQQAFNEHLFYMGDCYYRIKMLNEEIAKLNDQINTHKQKLDSLGKDAQKARQKMQQEVAAKVKEGAEQVTGSELTPVSDLPDAK